MSRSGAKRTLPFRSEIELPIAWNPATKLSVVQPLAALAAGWTKDIGCRSATLSTGMDALWFGTFSIPVRVVTPSKRTMSSGSKVAAAAGVVSISKAGPVEPAGSAARGATTLSVTFTVFSFEVAFGFGGVTVVLKNWLKVGTTGIVSAGAEVPVVPVTPELPVEPAVDPLNCGLTRSPAVPAGGSALIRTPEPNVIVPTDGALSRMLLPDPFKVAVPVPGPTILLLVVPTPSFTVPPPLVITVMFPVVPKLLPGVCVPPNDIVIDPLVGCPEVTNVVT